MDRTAICITGQSRTLSANNYRIAKSFHEHIYRQLAHAGFDVFLVKPGPVHIGGRLKHQWTANSSRLIPHSVDARGRPNELFEHQRGEQHNLWYNESDPRWKLYFMNLRTTDPYHHKIYIQNLLQMAHDQWLCNQMIQRTARAYRYYIRLRPDMHFLSPLPRLGSLNFHNGSIVFGTCLSTVDTFGIGERATMGVYFDRYHDYHRAFPQTKTFVKKGWTTESFLVFILEQTGAKILQHADIRGKVVRAPHFTRSNPPTTELQRPVNNTLMSSG